MSKPKRQLAHARANCKPKSTQGFSLIELVIVILIVGIISVVAATSMPDMLSIRINQAAYKIQSDIRYAQKVAVATQKRTAIFFNAAANTYSISIENTEGQLDWSIIEEPLTHNQFSVSLNQGDFIGVDITRVYFNSNNRNLVFDQSGSPYSYDAGAGTVTPLSGQAGVRLNAIKDIRVTQNTGRVYLFDLS